MQKSLSDMAKYMKNIISPNIPDAYSIKPMFNHIASDADIRSGVLAYRELLYLICDRLVADGGLYDKPLAKEKEGIISHPSFMEGYPFFNYVKSVLYNIGVHGQLIDNNASIVIGDMELLATVLNSGGGSSKSKILVPKMITILKFLNSCGILFDGINLDDKKSDITKVTSLKISYPDRAAMLTGLKVMAIAQRDLLPKKVIAQSDSILKRVFDVFLRCDYSILTNEGLIIASVLKDVINSLSNGVQDFILSLHQHALDMELVCDLSIYLPDIDFAYFYKNKEIWSLKVSCESGYRFLLKAQNIQKYAEVIKTFPMSLQDKIALGYGCDRRKFGNPCVRGCHGFSFALDESILDIKQDIMKWIDAEMSCLTKGKK